MSQIPMDLAQLEIITVNKDQPEETYAILNSSLVHVLEDDERHTQFTQQQQQQRLSVPPQTVNWLCENYETAEGVSLPRSTLYSHYQTHCQQQAIEPVNAASFGKLIRSVFLGLRTRRLGTRGNSKYHYYGIRIKPTSPLAKLPDLSYKYDSNDNNGTIVVQDVKRLKSSSQNSINSSINDIKATTSNGMTNSTGDVNHSNLTITNNNNTNNNNNSSPSSNPEALKSHLGDAKIIFNEVWPEEIAAFCDDNEPPALATSFAFAYRKHYENVMQAIGNLNFNSVETLWRQFWQAEITNNCQSGDNCKGHCLTLDQLHQLSSSSTSDIEVDGSLGSLCEWIIQTDYTLYNSIISSLLLPNLLKPIPQQLIQQIRNFAKNANTWMENSLEGYGRKFIQQKLLAVGAFSHTLRRYTSLNHLSSAAQAVLQNQSQIQQMINDLSRVDFKNVQEQAAWLCRCDFSTIEQIETSFKQLLMETNPFEKWGVWCEQILDLCIQDNEVQSLTQFFLKWGFYSSLVIRDLTLRSATSFGSFHLIRLLFDEYLFYLIEHRVAKAKGKTPIQILAEKLP